MTSTKEALTGPNTVVLEKEGIDDEAILLQRRTRSPPAQLDSSPPVIQGLFMEMEKVENNESRF